MNGQRSDARSHPLTIIDPEDVHTRTVRSSQLELCRPQAESVALVGLKEPATINITVDYKKDERIKKILSHLCRKFIPFCPTTKKTVNLKCNLLEPDIHNCQP